QPQFTYGPQTIVWKTRILPFCIFKIGDSGRPTRSFLKLLDEMLGHALQGNIYVKLSLLNLLLQLMNMGLPFDKMYDKRLGRGALRLPYTPACGTDIEAHIRDQVNVSFGGLTVALYDVESLQALQEDVQYNADWMQAVAPI
ncbi:MAG TPA: hypothetical protein VJ276_04950, partial [Thermoanaerobaculia bacterium]|nr:hypothetical protein [Thermoanaerobaculia bacterium]